MKHSIKLNNEINIDLLKLIDTKLLIQANSGGGKSWAIRRIIEQAFGKVQIIVIDPEGEFTNLREEYDFVYAGKDGDAAVQPRSAGLLAKRLLELKVSAIVDLYELHPQERKHFVKVFCEALVNAPKELWHDCLVIIDEAHIFAPEKGESEAMGPMIDLASRGRKRGFGTILATQRLPKLNKDVAAECNNKLIGRASQDIDRKRAAEELGFTTKEQILSLRNLDPGEFYVFGPAISREVIKTTIGDVKVKPAPRSQSRYAPPPPSAQIKKILGKLADLPAEAQKEATTISELKSELTQLKRHRCEKVAKADPKDIKMQITHAISRRDKEWEKIVDGWKAYANGFYHTVKAAWEKLDTPNKPADKPKMTLTPSNLEVFNLPVRVDPTRPKNIVSLETPKQRIDIPIESIGLSGPEQRILNALAWFETLNIMEPEQVGVAFLAGYTYGGGGFNNPRGALRTKGLVEYRGDRLALTEAGRALSNPPDMGLTTEDLHEQVLKILPGPEQKILKILLTAYPNSLSNEEVASEAGYTAGSGGFNNPKGKLRTLGLIEYPQPGKLKAKSLLFLDR